MTHDQNYFFISFQNLKHVHILNFLRPARLKVTFYFT